MKICSKEHEEICHDRIECPLCEAIFVITKLREKIEEIEEEETRVP